MGGSNAQNSTGGGGVSPSMQKMINNPNTEVRRATLASPSDIAAEYRRLDMQDEMKRRQAEALAAFLQQSTQGIGQAVQMQQPSIGMPPLQSSGLSGNRMLIQFQPLSPTQAFSARPELFHQGIASGISNALGGITNAYAMGRK